MRTGPGAVADGYIANGKTTIRWGTEDLFGVYDVLRFHQKPRAENLPLLQGAGLTSTVVTLLDGSTWELTVRDDVNMAVPQVGTRILLVDAAGLVPGGEIGVAYSCIVEDAQFDVAPKQAAERTVTATKFTLIA